MIYTFGNFVNTLVCLLYFYQTNKSSILWKTKLNKTGDLGFQSFQAIAGIFIGVPTGPAKAWRSSRESVDR